MSIDGVLLAAIKQELEDKLLGGRIDKIYQPAPHVLSLTIRQNALNQHLVISAEPQEPRLHLSNINFTNPLKPPDFCMLLRKYLSRATIIGIEQPGFERILKLEIKLRENLYYLIVEIMGRHSNIILVNEQGQVLDAIKRINKEISRQRELYPGARYVYPPTQNKLNPLQLDFTAFKNKIPQDFAKASFQAIMSHFRGIGPDLAREIVYQAGLDYQKPYQDLSSAEIESLWESFNYTFKQIKAGKFKPSIGLNENGKALYLAAFPLSYHPKVSQLISFETPGSLLDYYLEKVIIKNSNDHFRNKLFGVCNSFLKKNQRKQQEIKEKLLESQKAEHYKKLGELLIINLSQLRKGQQEARVTDFYDPEQKEISINLDPSKGPQANAQAYFKKYQKAKNSVQHLKKQLGILKHEERYLEEVILNLEQAEAREELEAIQAELVAEGYIKEKQKRKKDSRRQSQPLPPHKFKSSEGYEILVGRNNHQNDYLSKTIAKKNDLWLHIKDLAGSHVIIRNHTGGEIPETTLLEAASLAAYFSKGRQSKNVPVDYTQIKNVRKPKGAKPGLVYYENYQTLYVNPDENLVQKLKLK